MKGGIRSQTDQLAEQLYLSHEKFRHMHGARLIRPRWFALNAKGRQPYLEFAAQLIKQEEERE